MARIRTIKPDYFSSGKQLRLSLEAAFLNIALWGMADDEGRLRDDELEIGARCPRLINRGIEKLLNELSAGCFLYRYEINGKRYIQVHNWADHQSINKPRKSMIPEMTEGSRIFPVALPENSRGKGKEGKGKERKGKEWNGKEGNGEERINRSPEEPAPLTLTPFQRFWEAYPKKVGKHAAFKAWNKARINGSLEKVLTSLENQKKSDQWTKEGGRFICNPATWLNQGRWEDEVFIPDDRPALRKAQEAHEYSKDLYRTAVEMYEHRKHNEEALREEREEKRNEEIENKFEEEVTLD